MTKYSVEAGYVSGMPQTQRRGEPFRVIAAHERARFGHYLAELPGSLMLAVLTAVVTLVMAVALSALLGQENRDHRIAGRCQSALIAGLLREIITETPELAERIDLSQYPPVNVSDIDCGLLYDPIPGGTDGS